MAGYQVDTEGAVALTAATPRTVLLAQAAADAPLRVTEIMVSFDGANPTASPVLVELVTHDNATAGTSTAATVKQTRGRARNPQASARKAFTAEPTVLTSTRQFYVTPAGIPVILQFPLGQEPETPAASAVRGIGVRCTAPAGVNVRASMEFEEG